MVLSYNISVFPEISPVFTGDTSVQLTIPYNTHITMNVSATLCGEEVVTIKHFFYGKLDLQAISTKLIAMHIILLIIAKK